MTLKNLLELYDNWNGIIKVNEVVNDKWKVHYKGKTSDFVFKKRYKLLGNREVESFGFYDNEFCVRIK